MASLALKENLPPLHLRRATLIDLAWIANIESIVQETPWSLSIMELSLMTDEHFFVLECTHKKDVDINGNPFLGFLIANVLPPTSDITNFAVHPRAQKKGLGQMLLDHLYQRMIEKSIEELRLDVRASNEKAIMLYEKNGFVTTARRKNYYDLANRAGKEDGLLMTKHF